MENIEKLKLFVNELNDIMDEKLQEFAVKLIINAPDYFFTVPASSSKKYHPSFAREVGGLVMHTRCVEFYAMCNAESFDFNQHDKDLLIIAALAHDIKKQGDGNSKYTVWEHPELACRYVIEMQKQYPDLIAYDDAMKIANAVLSHMGKWAHHKEFAKNKKHFPMPETLFENALQSADYIASRKELLNFDFRDTKNVNLSIIANKCLLEEDKNIGKVKFSFGKHKGNTIEKVVSEDYSYVEWMLSVENFKHSDFLDKIKAYMKLKKIFYD